MASRELIPLDSEGRLPSAELSMGRTPELALAEAKLAAKALQSVIALKPKPVIFNGEIYLEFEDWSTIASFYGCTVKLKSDRFCQYRDASGFEATAQLIRMDTGQVLSEASAMCLDDEENWGMRPFYEWRDKLDKDGRKIWDEKKQRYKSEKVAAGEKPVPLFQLRSMAQTRAGSKVCRNVFSRIPVLAGYKPTPAEEISDRDLPGNDYIDEPKQKVEPPVTQDQARTLVQAWKSVHGDSPEAQSAWKVWMQKTFLVSSSLKIPGAKFEDALTAIKATAPAPVEMKVEAKSDAPEISQSTEQKRCFEAFGILGWDLVRQAQAIKDANNDWPALLVKLEQELERE